MSIEKALEDATAAIKELTAALKAGGAAAPAAAGEPTKRSPGRPPKADAPAPAPAPVGVSRSEMQAALNEVKEAKGVADAKAIIKEVGGVDKMADIPEKKVQAVYDAAKAAMGGDDGVEGGDDGM